MKRKLLFTIVALLCSISTWAGTVDYTSKMSNAKANWTNASASYGGDGVGVERYNGDTTPFSTGDVLYQTITGLDNGYYEVSFYAWENYADHQTAAIDTGRVAQVFANSAVEGIYVAKNKGGRSWDAKNTYTLLAQVTDGSLKYGIKNTASGGNWAVCRAISLIYLGTSLEKNTNITSALANPSFENVYEYKNSSNTYTKYAGWTDETTGDKMDLISTNALSGKDGTYFAERWWHDSTMDIHQTTTTLPAGFYRITAYAKAESGNDIKIYAKAGNGDDVTTSVGDEADYSVEVYLSSANTIKLGLKGSHVTQKHVAVDNFRLTYLGDPKAELTTLQGTIDANYLNNATYTNVGGSERTNLNSAQTLAAASETAAAYETAISSVQAYIDAFVAARDNYDALAAINAKITAVGTLTYASSAKKPSTHEGTNSSDAATYATSLTTALRAYVESNALAEGVVGATNYTSYIKEPSCVATEAGGENSTYNSRNWTCYDVRANGGQGYTNAAGTTKGYYFDSNGNFWNQNVWGASLNQTVSGLPRGKYLLTVTSRSSGDFSYLRIIGNGINQVVTNPYNVFGNGWDDTSVEFTVGAAGTATIEFAGNNGGSKYKWFSVDNFRLVRIGNLDAVTLNEGETASIVAKTADVTLTRSIAADTWSTFVVPFDIDNTTLKDQFGDDVRVSEFSASDKTGVTFTPMETPAITANKPVLVRVSSAKSSFTFDGVEIKVATPTFSQAGVNFVGNYAGEITIPENAYYVKSNTIKKSSGNGKQKLQGFRAYFTVDADSPVKAFFENDIFIDDEATGIVNLNDNLNKNEAIYNLAGQRVSKAVKGLYIKNGKKVVIK